MFILNMAILLNNVYVNVLPVSPKLRLQTALNAPFTKTFDKEAGLTNSARQGEPIRREWTFRERDRS